MKQNPHQVICNLTIRNEASTTRVVTWRLTDLEPLGTETISYRVEALRSGTFVNWAEIQVGSVDGTAIYQPLYVDSVIAIGGSDRGIEIDG
ncbi:MAG: hypothetical protein NTX42_05815 [Methanothrix sp.]|nr:hypothetical protein [Methanothrix sp.]